MIDLNLKSVAKPNEAELKDKIQEWCEIKNIE